MTNVWDTKEPSEKQAYASGVSSRDAEVEALRKQLAASRKWNQDLLDAARETRPDDDRRAAEWGLAVFAASKKLETEFEAYKVNYEYNDVDLDMAVEFEQTLRKTAEARAECAESQRDAMRKALEFARSQVEGSVYGRTKTLAVIDAALTPPYSGWSGENAKLREALEQIADPHHDIEFAPSARELRAIARAALAPSPAGREG